MFRSSLFYRKRERKTDHNCEVITRFKMDQIKKDEYEQIKRKNEVRSELLDKKN